MVVSWCTGEDVPALPPLDRSAHPKSTQPVNVWFGHLRSSSISALPTPSALSSGLTTAVPWPAPPSNSARPLQPATPLRSLPKAPAPMASPTPAAGWGASPSPDLGEDQQRRQGGVLDGSTAAVDGADRPTTATAVEASPGASGSASGAVALPIASAPP